MNKNVSNQLKKLQADRILLQAIATSADSEAFLILYDRYGQKLLRYFDNVTNDTDTALDLSQNFWLYIWQNAPGSYTKTWTRLKAFSSIWQRNV